MKYDFDRLVPRKNTNCMKWDDTDAIFGTKDIIPMWVADMDLPIAKPITDAIRERTEHEIYGYPIQKPLSVIKAVIDRMQRLYGWNVSPEWVLLIPGIIPALYTTVKAFSCPGNEVILQGPVYHPFWSAIEDNGCHVSNNQLILKNSMYEIDFEDLVGKFNKRENSLHTPSRPKLMLLCSPHNPVGRVWTVEELRRTGEIVIGNGAIVVADEVHSELLFHNAKHTPFSTLSEEFEQHSITCISPSKAFNLAGLYTSAIIIPSAGLRKRFLDAKKNFVPKVNVFGLIAMEAAYRYSDEWLEQLMAYLHDNLEFLLGYFKRKIPKIAVIKPQGTYLVWLDCRRMGLSPAILQKFMIENAKVGLHEGSLFGPSGAGFARMNIACPRLLLVEALKRIEHAVNNMRN